MFRALSSWAEIRWPWALLAASALALELTALFFQHVMNMDPCVMCVYERVATGGILFAGIIGFIYPKSIWVRLAAYGIWGWSVIEGLLIAIEHVEIQFPSGPFGASCAFFPEFWVPLEQWFPALFNPTGLCDEVNWLFLGWTMPQWLIVCYAIYGLIFVGLLGSRLAIAKKP